ncbi:4-hydroxythreonine-4-phosphate dehydrogenase PdxA [Sanyastnella coralliicola]|uniref:4-hydroxythreonine-4-phosphate dehydrogenase PdxA n=1 Tax=Sanyastnella coralliicola TaxID=3069118 RepID=UPI0027BAFC73|nr:4-hydroxythreonine-4-phosphate dehydrogenase PdxA [Longitalea sp. SCSIO 12813]
MSKVENQVRVGITIGDPNGIGIETILKVFADQRMNEIVLPIIYGNTDILRFHRKVLDMGDVRLNSTSSAEEVNPKKINVVNVWDDKWEPTLGSPDKEAGAYAFKSLKAAVDDLASNKIDVLVTCPINKDTIQSDEFNFPGHTEYLASMANVEESLMFLVSDRMRIGVATGHVPLKDVSANLTKESIIKKLRLMHESLQRDFGVNRPKIAVLGLNPHAGDNGLLGTEELDIILPAIREVENEMFVKGPYGADGFFGTAAFQQFDGVLAMYHDQGLAPFKALAFDSGVNYTAGLPIVRTSPDHGTGYEIAGKGQANEGSLRAAIFTAIDVYKYRKVYREMTANPLR